MIWTNQGGRDPRHQVGQNAGEFRSGKHEAGRQFSHRFDQEGYYFYHCTFHGAAGKVGMWGVVIVGNPPPPGGGEDEKDDKSEPRRPDRIPDDPEGGRRGEAREHDRHQARHVPGNRPRDDEQPRHQRCRSLPHDPARARQEGERIRRRRYRQCAIKNLTVRNYAGNGIFFNDSRELSGCEDRLDQEPHLRDLCLRFLQRSHHATHTVTAAATLPSTSASASAAPP